MQRWVANLLMGWLLFLVPGSTALAFAQPQQLLPVCCRTHGAHHCALAQHRPQTGPAWRATGCPYAHLQHAGLVLPLFLAAQQPSLSTQIRRADSPAADLGALSSYLAGLPGSRAPPFLLQPL